MNSGFSCFIIGIGSHLIECAEILLQRGHRICAIVSTGPLAVDWTRKHGIRHIETSSDLIATLSRQPFDYLFSIVYPAVIPDEVLALPRRGAINFHDGPLPRYAGLNATSWALMNQEKTHGVTWHLMSAEVDAGDILKQRQVAVLEEDTSFSLNARCYEAAIQSFAELVDELSTDRVRPCKQDLACRTYFGKSKRPPAACVLRWNQPARKIAALVRALDFGPYTNPLGMAKLILADEVFVVPEVRVVPGESQFAPATITAVEEDGVLVSTTDGQIALNRLLTFAGQPVSAIDAVNHCGFTTGDRLVDFDPKTVDELNSFNEMLSRHETFWVRRLASQKPVELPFMNHSPAAARPARYATTRTMLPAELATSLEAHDGTTRSDLLVAAFAAYLGRIGGSYTFDLPFSHPGLNHGAAWSAPLFAPNVPLHVELDPRAGSNAALQTLGAELMLVKRHATYARDVILRYPELRSRAAHGDWRLSPIAVEQVAREEDHLPSSDSRLTLRIRPDGNELQWVYDEALYDRETIGRIQRQFLAFLENVTADDSRALADVPVLSDAERRMLLIEWNNTRVRYPQERCIHQVFEAQAEETPDTGAVVSGNERLTYQELNGRSNQLAHLLQSWGVEPEVPVGVALERSLEMVVGLYAILKAGGAYVPLDPAYPPERIAYMVQEAGVRVVLTQERLSGRLPAFEGEVIRLDTEWRDRVAHQDKGNPACEATLENPAYIIYTSGSTGRPKGVVNTHRGILNRLLWMQDEYRLTASDRVLQKTPFSFDVSVWEFFWPLMFGARLVVARPEGHKDGEYLVRTIREQHVTVVHFVPSMLQLFLETPDVEKCDCLRHVICSGEALSLDLQNRFFRRLDARLHNLYGPTEAAVDVTYWECRRNGHLKTVPIGRPVANTKIYILDSHMQPTPVGVPGELHIGGVQVARGYVNRPDLTAEKFVPDPFSDDPGARLYKTGDLARYLPDGNIEYLGRLDHQVKIRGLRIELAEIESVLIQHPTVREAALVAREDTPGDQRLVAYVVLKPASPLNSSELRDHLKRSLPDYMIPAAFVELDALPLTSSGKVDRRGLPAPKEQPRSEGAYLAPRNGLEKAIAEIWRELLHVEQVGIHDNFFDLGGHSLLIVQAHRRLRGITDKDLSVADLFRFSTISALAEHLSRDSRDEDARAQVAVQRSVHRAQARKAAMTRRRQRT